MPYICYLYEGEGQVPYMEILPEASLDDARSLMRDLLHQRPNYRRAELWEGDRMVSRSEQDRLRPSRDRDLGLRL